MNISERTINMMQRAYLCSEAFSLNYIGTEQMVYAMADSDAPASQVLSAFDISKEDILREIAQINGKEPKAFRTRLWIPIRCLLCVLIERNG